MKRLQSAADEAAAVLEHRDHSLKDNTTIHRTLTLKALRRRERRNFCCGRHPKCEAPHNDQALTHTLTLSLA